MAYRPDFGTGTVTYPTATGSVSLTPAQISAIDPNCAANYVPNVSGCATPGVNAAVVKFFQTAYPAREHDVGR